MVSPDSRVEENAEYVRKGASKISDEDVENVVEKSEEIKRKFRLTGPLSRFMSDGYLLLGLVRDYWKGRYRRLPRWSIAAAAFALLYVLNPFDMMPDMIPFVGAIDDAGVLGACLMLVEQDLAHYRKWIASLALPPKS